MTDELKLIIDRVAQYFPGCYVSDTLPPSTSLEAKLPIIQIVDLPGGDWLTPWQAGQGPLISVFACDIYIFGTKRSETRALAENVQRVLWRLAGDPFVGVTKVVTESGFSRATDWNPRVLREHGEFSIHVRRI
jgi:hypothetical protein